MDNIYKISNDALEILSGTSNRTSPLYLEAANNIENDEKKAIDYIKRFLRSVNKVSKNGKLDNADISKTKGNIRNLKRYEEIDKSLEMLSKHIPNNKELKALISIKSKLESNSSDYMNAYNNKIALLIMEYETAAYLLIEGLGFVIVSYMTITINNNGDITVLPKKGSLNKGIISTLIVDLDKELNSPNHDKYIKELVDSKSNSPITEATGDATAEALKLITAIVTQVFSIFKRGSRVIKLFIRTIFGILPILRSIIYFHYKRKVDKIKSLELNAYFIQLNIEMLKNKTNMNEKQKTDIIKKQMAKAEAYLKAAEKLRAELVEAEKDTAMALSDDNKTMNQPVDDDFILESSDEVFTEDIS